MEGNEESPFNDVDMPADGDAKVNSCHPQADPARYEHVPKTVAELKAICGHAWVEKSALSGKTKLIGEGAFATVLKGMYTKPDGTVVPAAIKQLKPEIINQRDLKDLIMESTILSRLRHPCIMELYGVGTTQGESLDASTFLVVTEYADGGTLKDLLYRQMEAPFRRLYTQKDAVRWCLQVARGLRYLHNSDPIVIHRDIKPENILFVGKKVRNVKIADFGLSVLVGRSMEDQRSSALNRLESRRMGSVHGSHRDTLPKAATPASTSADGSPPPKHPQASSHSAPPSPSLARKFSTLPMRSNTLTRFSAAQITSTMLKNQRASVLAFELTGMTGSLAYMAPEVYRGEERVPAMLMGSPCCPPGVMKHYIMLHGFLQVQVQYNEKADVYAFACVMLEILNYELTFYALQCRDQVADLMTYVESVCLDGHRPEIPQRIPEPLRKLIGRCWAEAPGARPSMNEVVEELTGIALGMGILVEQPSSNALAHPIDLTTKSMAYVDTMAAQQDKGCSCTIM